MRTVRCADLHGSASIQCDPKLRPSSTQQCSTGISCSTESPTENDQIEEESSTITTKTTTTTTADFNDLEDDDSEEDSDDFMSRDDPRSYRYERSKDSLNSFQHQSLPKPERLVDQQVPTDPT